MAQKGGSQRPGLGMIGGAGVVGVMAAGALTACAVLGAGDLPAGLARRRCSSAQRLAAVAYVLVERGKERVGKAGAPIPEQTIETVKEDVEWAKTRATSARK